MTRSTIEGLAFAAYQTDIQSYHTKEELGYLTFTISNKYINFYTLYCVVTEVMVHVNPPLSKLLHLITFLTLIQHLRVEIS
jgi:hypothetical protein